LRFRPLQWVHHSSKFANMRPLTQLSTVVMVSWSYLLIHQTSADQIVLLNRTGNHLDSSKGTVVWEPFFSPKTINASVGEQIHFVALLDDITSYIPNGNVWLFRNLLTMLESSSFHLGLCRI